METSNTTGSLAERLKSWRSELKGMGLTKDDRDELQSHLEDILEELRTKGLSEEEAWIVATRRIGATGDIRREFRKMQEGRIPVFNHILFGTAVIFLVVQIGLIGMHLMGLLLQVGRISWVSAFCLGFMVVFLGGIVYRRQKLKTETPWLFFMRCCSIMMMAWTFSLITSADIPSCYNSNRTLTNNSPKSEIYVTELLKHFARTGTDNIYYKFAYTYSEKNRNFIVLNAIGKNFCGYFSLDVTGSERMVQIVKNKGKGYRGSLWKGVEFDTFSDKSGTRFIFKSVEKIVD